MTPNPWDRPCKYFEQGLNSSAKYCPHIHLLALSLAGILRNDFRLTRQRVDILVATPRRLFWALFETEKFDCRIIECLILDEGGSYARHGLFTAIVNQNSPEPGWRQNRACCFPATLEGGAYKRGFWSKELLNEPVQLQVADPSRKETRQKFIKWLHFSRRLLNTKYCPCFVTILEHQVDSAVCLSKPWSLKTN